MKPNGRGGGRSIWSTYWFGLLIHRKCRLPHFNFLNVYLDSCMVDFFRKYNECLGYGYIKKFTSDTPDFLYAVSI